MEKIKNLGLKATLYSLKLLEYDTPKYVHVQTKFAGIFFRFVQLCVLLFIALYLVWWQGGYQKVGYVASVTTYKLRGSSLSSANSSFTRVSLFWDPVDYTIPPKQKDEFIVPTRYLYTPNQMYGYCPEDPQYSTCNSDSDCAADEYVPKGDGVMNGTCNNATHSCFIFGWCPVQDKTNDIRIPNFLNFTVFIRNYIYFPSFPEATPKYAHRNLGPPNSIIPDLSACDYDPTEAKSNQSLIFCPIFTLRTLLTNPDMILDGKPMDVESLVKYGGLVEISIHWECNLDFSIENCVPVYKTRRLDRENVKVSRGYNYMKADYSYDDDGLTKRRYLYKLYGIKFNIVVTGRARKFNFYQLIVTFGAGISYFAIATLLADLFILRVYKNKKLYRREKYQVVPEEEEDEGNSADVLKKLLDQKREIQDHSFTD